eukprot:GILI01013603.1.p1 GENE.GILI01013603.1~~GILI01013603.1.p1  ORF type:complete len:813 (-),score=198.72 GILI01013603.1:149-2548(-)
MSARQITDTILTLTTAYLKLGPSNCETPAEFAKRRLTERKAGESKKNQFSSDVITFIGLLLDGFVRHYDVSKDLFEGYCAGMQRNHEDQVGMSFLAYLCIYRYNEVDFRGDSIGPLVFHVSARTRVVEFIQFMCDPELVAEHATKFWQAHVQDAYIEDFLAPTCCHNASALRMAILTPTERGETFSGSSKHRSSLSSGRKASLEEGRTNSETDDDEEGDLHNRLHAITATPESAGHKPDQPTVAPPRRPKLPPAGVREMKYTIPEKRAPVTVTNKASDAELRAVEAARHGKKLSALDDATKAENRAREEAIPFQPFSANARPSNMARLLDEQRRREQEEMSPLPPRPSVEEVRRNISNVAGNVEVKSTKAALKRELALVQKKREEEEARFAQRLAALRDDTEFRDWQAQGRQADEEERMRQMQQRKLDTMLADEEARQTKAKHTKLRQAETREMKEEIGELRGQVKRENELKHKVLAQQAEVQRQRLVADVAVAVEAVQKTRQKAFEDAKQLRQRNEVEMALQEELEFRRKAEMIQNIKKMQKESAELRKEAILAKQMANRQAIYSSITDDGATIMHAAMEEMSFVDLRKLLQATSKEQDRLVEEKRLRIVATREAEKKSLQQMEEAVMLHRGAVRAEKDSKREDKRQVLSAAAAAAKEKEEQQIQALQAKLAAKREERQRTESNVKEEERRRAMAAQLLMKDSRAVEKKKFAQMEMAAENTVLAAQNSRLRIRQVQRAISANEAGKRETNLNSAQRKLQSARALSDEINEVKKELLTKEEAHDAIVRNALYAEMARGR